MLLRQSELPPRHSSPWLCKFIKLQLDLRLVSLCWSSLWRKYSILHLSSPIQRRQSSPCWDRSSAVSRPLPSWPQWLKDMPPLLWLSPPPFFSPRTAFFLPRWLNGKLVLVKELCLAVPYERSPGCRGQRYPAMSSVGLARPREPGCLGRVLTHQAPSEQRGPAASLGMVSHVLCNGQSFTSVHCSWPENWLDGAGATLGYSAKVLNKVLNISHFPPGQRCPTGARQGWVVDTLSPGTS